jgi:uncharacterized protein YbjT (DUF2867 family)
MATILVTAATGHIGREIIAALAGREGVQVLAGSRRVDAAAKQLEGLPSVRVVELDLDDADGLARALEGVDAVCQVSPLSPSMAEQTRRLVAASQRAGVQHLVRSSLIGADEPDPITEGTWHQEADRAIRSSDIPYTILRPTQYFQNFAGGGSAATVKEQGVLYLPLGEAAVANIDTRDIGEIAANVLLAERGAHAGKEYALTGGEASTMHDLAAAIGEAIGKPVRYVPVSEEQTRQSMLGAGLPGVIVEAILGWFAYCRADKASRVWPDAERLLGKKPRTPRQFAQDHAHCFK